MQAVAWSVQSKEVSFGEDRNMSEGGNLFPVQEEQCFFKSCEVRAAVLFVACRPSKLDWSFRGHVQALRAGSAGAIAGHAASKRRRMNGDVDERRRAVVKKRRECVHDGGQRKGAEVDGWNLALSSLQREMRMRKYAGKPSGDNPIVCPSAGYGSTILT